MSIKSPNYLQNVLSKSSVLIKFVFIFTGLTAMLFKTWHDNGGSFLIMVHFLFGVGGIISPLMSKPFLIKIDQEESAGNRCLKRNRQNFSSIADSASTVQNSSEIKTNSGQSSFNTSFDIDCVFIEFSNITDTIGCTSENCTSQNTSSSDLSSVVFKETNVHFAYLISACIVFSAAVPFLVFYITSRNKSEKSDIQSDEATKEGKVSNKVQILATGLLCVLSFLGTGLVDSFPSFLATFGLLQLGWSQDTGSSMTSLYSAMYAVGNLFSVFILRCISSSTFIFTMYISSMASIALLYMCVTWTLEPLLWLTVAITGLTTSAILPTVFVWTQEAVTPVSGKITSAFLFSGSTGAILNPILLGYLMDFFSPMWLLYLGFAEVALCTVLFTVAVLVVRKYLKESWRMKTYNSQIRKSNIVVRNISDNFQEIMNQRANVTDL